MECQIRQTAVDPPVPNGLQNFYAYLYCNIPVLGIQYFFSVYSYRLKRHEYAVFDFPIFFFQEWVIQFRGH